MRTDESGVKWVTMTHPATGGETEVTEQAFDEVYEAKGWELKKDPEPTFGDQDLTVDPGTEVPFTDPDAAKAASGTSPDTEVAGKPPKEVPNA